MCFLIVIGGKEMGLDKKPRLARNSFSHSFEWLFPSLAGSGPYFVPPLYNYYETKLAFGFYIYKTFFPTLL